MNGKVKFFNSMKGFGFLTGDDDNTDYFVHQSDLEGGVELANNDPVSFDTEQGDKGLKAVNVKKL